MVEGAKHAGAGANLRKILTADEAAARRWAGTLKKSGKTWADVRLSSKAAAKIADAVLGEILGAEYRRGVGKKEDRRAKTRKSLCTMG
jgi:hypothetical protein